jgi:hypothetical protein
LTSTTSKTAKKVQLLKTLIDHPRTGEEERDAARRMLKRLLSKAAASGEKTPQWADRRTYGDKYQQVRGMRLTDIAKLMRADIKVARKIGLKAAEPGAIAIPDPIAEAPAGIKFSVTTQLYSGGGSIDITVKNIPADWGYAEEEHCGHVRKVATPALQALAAELAAIHRAYNYNGSDLTTDYFDVNYYGGVHDERGLHL